MQTDKPIFILSCGGRTGSTWLQRLLTSTGGVLIWGEAGLFRWLENYRLRPRWTLPEDYGANDLHRFRQEKENAWTSNLLPLEEHLSQGLAAFMETSLGQAALEEGYPRWGVKEVTWRSQDVELIQKLWPEASTLFLTRRLEECYRSAAAMGWLWNPLTCHQFIDNWLHTTEQLLCIAIDERRQWVKYERLVADLEQVRGLAEWCELPSPRTGLAKLGYGTMPVTEFQRLVYLQRKPRIDLRNTELGYDHGRL